MFVFLVIAAVYVLAHFVDVFKWWAIKAKLVGGGIWSFLKKIFKKKVKQ